MSNIYCVGFPRTATTFLYDNLDFDSSIDAPFYKERQILFHEQQRLLNSRVADFTPYVIYFSELSEKINSDDVVIICIRDYVDRAESMYFQILQKYGDHHSLDKILSVEKVLLDKIFSNEKLDNDDLAFVVDYGILSGSCYKYWVDRFTENLQSENILVCDFADVINRRYQLQNRFYDVCGLKFKKNMVDNSNYRSFARSRFISYILYGKNPFMRRSISVLSKPIPSVVKRNLFRYMAIYNKKRMPKADSIVKKSINEFCDCNGYSDELKRQNILSL